MSLLAKMKKPGKLPPDVIERSVNFEATKELMTRTSERRAWIVAASSVLLSLILAAGYFFVMPLKEKVPYLVTVDPYTGTSALARLIGNFDDMTITTNEAVNKANISNFITAYEAYDWDLWNTRDGLVVYAMAAGEVLKDYERLYDDKIKSPTIVLGREKRQFVRIKSLVLTQKNNNGFPAGATARLDRFIIDKTAQSAMTSKSFIVTLAFEYKSNLQMPEEMRVHNPLGFRVTAYRVDPDSSTSQDKDIIMRELTNTAVGQPLVAPKDATSPTKQ